MQKGSAYERTVLAILGLIILVLAGLLLRGLISPGYTVRKAVQAPASCDQVWPWAAEAERRPVWIAGLVGVVPLTYGGEGAGQRNLLLFRRDGERAEVGETVTIYRPGREWAAEWEGDQETASQSVRFAPQEGGCLIRYELAVMPAGLEARFMAPFSWYVRSGAAEEGLARLADLVEG